jgi:hypothetical protein
VDAEKWEAARAVGKRLAAAALWDAWQPVVSTNFMTSFAAAMWMLSSETPGSL